jgi:hypothetical protein
MELLTSALPPPDAQPRLLWVLWGGDSVRIFASWTQGSFLTESSVIPPFTYFALWHDGNSCQEVESTPTPSPQSWAWPSAKVEGEGARPQHHVMVPRPVPEDRTNPRWHQAAAGHRRKRTILDSPKLVQLAQVPTAHRDITKCHCLGMDRCFLHDGGSRHCPHFRQVCSLCVHTSLCCGAGLSLWGLEIGFQRPLNRFIANQPGVSMYRRPVFGDWAGGM